MNQTHLVLAGIFCYAGMLSAQEVPDTTGIERLEEVTVTDARIPLRWAESGKAVVRMERADLESYRGASVAEILNTVTGLELSGSRSRPGEVLGVYARGGRSRQVLVLIDGLRVTDPSSASQQYDLRLLQTDEIESVEILKGAASSLYGTNAATAVISIRTRKAAAEPLALSVNSSVRTLRPAGGPAWNMGETAQSARLSGSVGEWTYAVSLAHTRADGLSSLEDSGGEKDPFSNLSAGTSVQWSPNTRNQLSVVANQTQLAMDYDDTFSMTDAPFRYLSTQERIGASWEHSGRLGWEARVAYSFYESQNQSDFPSEFVGSNWNSDVLLRYRFSDEVTALAGVSLAEDRMELAPDRTFTLLDPYLNWVWTSPAGINLNAGLRLNHHSVYGDQWVYQFNPSWLLVRGLHSLKVFGSWATAYITPTLSQLYGPFGANPELKPEENRTLEAGVEWRHDTGMQVSLQFFDRREDGTVLFNNADFAYFNAEEALKVSGLEADFTVDLTESLTLKAGYAFTDRKGDAAIRIPKHKASLRLLAAPGKRLQLTGSLRYTGERTDTDFTAFQDVALEAFTLLDARGAFELIPGRLTGYLSVENILDRDFTEVIGFETPGRTLRAGLQLNLN